MIARSKRRGPYPKDYTKDDSLIRKETSTSFKYNHVHRWNMYVLKQKKKTTPTPNI